MEQLESMFDDQNVKNEHQNPEDVDVEKALIVDLIETVKAHPSLYDRQAGNFQDGRNRQFLWQSVGEEMKLKGHNVTEKWNSLKRRYIRELSAITSSPNYSPRISKWPYFNVFDFLQPYVQQNLPLIKNDCSLVDTENEAGTSVEQAFDENLGKLLGIEAGEPKRKRLRSSKIPKDVEDHSDEAGEEGRFKNRSVMVKLWDARNEGFVASLCGLTSFLGDDQLTAFQKDTLCDLARRLLNPSSKSLRRSI